ncbi:hypothetical protein Syun_012221 [Stephania yunnanensis]|uniref:Uncharacterized protein n=1 Tax=Stephania yunnanensis TaxID=152371 RepID=A0AAP0JZ10_9MAGN
MELHAHQKRVVRTTSSGGVAGRLLTESGMHHELQWCGFDPHQKESSLHRKVSSSQVVTIGDGLETHIVGLMELDGDHNGHYDHQQFTSSRGLPHYIPSPSTMTLERDK